MESIDFNLALILTLVLYYLNNNKEAKSLSSSHFK